jgi:hypothetical protein
MGSQIVTHFFKLAAKCGFFFLINVLCKVKEPLTLHKFSPFKLSLKVQIREASQGNVKDLTSIHSL